MMIDRTRLPESKSQEVAGAAPGADAARADEPFPCPACGQLLGASCRVCVACKQPIDPAQIVRSPSVVAAATPAILQAVERARFSWLIFSVVLMLWILAATGVHKLLGPARAQRALLGVVLFSSVWVFHDARRKGVPKPARWALGSLLLWIVFFPWYLSRRRTPQAACPVIETEATPLVRALLVVLMVLLLLGIVGLIVKKG